jgi:pimeloyl-ACP methyl ester carboxylesterase
VPAFFISMAATFPPWMPPLFGAVGRVAPGLAARLAAELLCRPGGRNPPQPWEHEPVLLPAARLILRRGLHALSWGSDGPVVLAQHGWRGRPTQFVRLAAAIVPRGYRLVALDAPGHGVSPGHRLSTRILADELRAAADELGNVHTVVGHSFGGAAAGIAVDEGLDAKRLVIIGSPTCVSAMMTRLGAEIGLPGPARARLDRVFEAHARRPLRELDLIAFGPAVASRALIVHDEDDDVIPVAEARDLERAWPGARVLYTRGLGHRDLLAEPAVVEAVCAFVDSPG